MSLLEVASFSKYRWRRVRSIKALPKSQLAQLVLRSKISSLWGGLLASDQSYYEGPAGQHWKGCWVAFRRLVESELNSNRGRLKTRVKQKSNQPASLMQAIPTFDRPDRQCKKCCETEDFARKRSQDIRFHLIFLLYIFLQVPSPFLFCHLLDRLSCCCNSKRFSMHSRIIFYLNLYTSKLLRK